MRIWLKRIYKLEIFLRDLNRTNGGVVFFDEVHGFSRESVEQLHAVMEDFKYGNTDIPRFTLIGATTRSGLLTAPMRGRFGIFHHLDFYEPEDLLKIIIRSAALFRRKI